MLYERSCLLSTGEKKCEPEKRRWSRVCQRRTIIAISYIMAPSRCSHSFRYNIMCRKTTEFKGMKQPEKNFNLFGYDWFDEQ